jgi:cell division protein FtsZ
LRVTVVATGLGGERRPQFGIVNNSFKKAVGSESSHSSGGYSSNSASSGMFVPSFTNPAHDVEPSMPSAMDKVAKEPTVQETAKPAAKKQDNADYFDIPAFLRKQSD